MALGTTAAILVGLGAAGAATGISSLINKGASKGFDQIAMPQPPTADAAAEKAEKIGKKRVSTQSIYTSPLGVSGEANVARKTLLGQ